MTGGDNKKAYAYCPNLHCGFIYEDATSHEQTFKTLRNEGGEKGLGRGFCPRCGEKLNWACPHCGAGFFEKPERFCAACGKDLFREESEKKCRICGRPVYRSVDPQETIIVCSETCLAAFIKQYVRTCDQCGRRFEVIPGKNSHLIEVVLTNNDGKKSDFCSDKCLSACKARIQGGGG